MMDRDLGINLARVTEAAALASAKYLGKGKAEKADEVAVEQMRTMFDILSINGEVVIGEGEIDEAPMLYIGEKVGDGSYSQVDIAVDPVDGTTSLANGMDNAISVIAVAPRGCLLNAPDVYMNKIACGPRARGAINLSASATENIKKVAQRLNKDVSDITVSVLKRERHDELIKEIRATGARIRMVTDGDIFTAIATGFSAGKIDLMMGIGGAPEGVLAAAALKCLDGDFQGQFTPLNPAQKKRCDLLNVDLDKIYTLDDLVKGNQVLFAATGISSGDFLQGVEFLEGNTATTESLVLRKPSGTTRFIKSIHKLDQKLSDVDPKYLKRG